MAPNLFSMGMGQYARNELANTAFEVIPSPKSHSRTEKSSKQGPDMESSDPPMALPVRGKTFAVSEKDKKYLHLHKTTLNASHYLCKRHNLFAEVQASSWL